MLVVSLSKRQDILSENSQNQHNLDANSSI